MHIFQFVFPINYGNVNMFGVHCARRSLKYCSLVASQPLAKADAPLWLATRREQTMRTSSPAQAARSRLTGGLCPSGAPPCPQSHMIGLTCVSAQISSHQSHPVAPVAVAALAANCSSCSHLQQITALAAVAANCSTGPDVLFHLPRLHASGAFTTFHVERAGERRCLSRWGWGVHGEGHQ
jgi:hypothetical protein